MDFTNIIVVLLAVGALLGVGYYLFTKQLQAMKEDLNKGTDPVLMEWLKDMKSSVDKNSEFLNKQLSDQSLSLDQKIKIQNDLLNQRLNDQSKVMRDQTESIAKRLENAQEIISKVQNQLGGINEFGKDIKDLSGILKSPKLRGGLGEQFLYEILANYLPIDLYKTQYKFKDGETCDAVVFTDRGMIPIDSKFP